MANKLRGTGVALVTPMNKDTSIDFEGFEKLVDHVIKGGVDYLVLMGTTGESPTISPSEKKELLHHLINKVNGKIPLVYGLGSNNTSELLNEVRELKGLAIDAILSASPYYSKPSQEGIYQHYKALADESDFPIILYNVPHRTSSNISAETTLRLANHPNIIGTKEASVDLFQSAVIARDRPDDFLLISGDDCLALHILAMKGDGVISVCANAYPKTMVELVNAGLKGDFNTASAIHLASLKMFLMMAEEGNPTSVKAALEALEICNRTTRLPLIDASNQLVEDFGKLYK